MGSEIIQQFQLGTTRTDTLNGTTTNSYVAAADVDVRGCNWKTFILTNTDGSNALDYKCQVSSAPKGRGGQLEDEVAETELSAAGKARIRIRHSYSRIILWVKSATAGNHATYQLDYTLASE